MSSGRWWGAALLGLAFAASAAAAPSTPAREEPAEYDLLAQVVVQFTSFTRWPPLRLVRPDSPLVVCLWGEDPMADRLGAATRHPVGGHPVQLKRPDLDELGTCHVLWIAPTDPTSLRALLVRTGGKPILTAAADPSYLPLGVHLVVEPGADGTVMRVNLAELQRSGLEVDPRVLNLAVIERGTR